MQTHTGLSTTKLSVSNSKTNGCLEVNKFLLVPEYDDQTCEQWSVQVNTSVVFVPEYNDQTCEQWSVQVNTSVVFAAGYDGIPTASGV